MNEQVTRIPLETLRDALDVLIRHAAAQTPDGQVVIHRDAFWSVPPAEVSDVYSDSPELTIGLVSESWGHLEDMVADEARAIGYGFVWLSEVLRAIGAEIV